MQQSRARAPVQCGILCCRPTLPSPGFGESSARVRMMLKNASLPADNPIIREYFPPGRLTV